MVGESYGTGGVAGSGSDPCSPYGLYMTFLQTLAAFLVGGAVTLATQLLLDSRRERKSQDRADAASRIETKMAARLVILELISMLALLKAAQRTGRWWNALQLPVSAWQVHSHALSRSLPDATWRTVGSTFAGATGWNELARGARRYYWVMPRLNLRWLGAVDMLDAVRVGAAQGIRELLPLAVPSIHHDDPLHKLAMAELDEIGGDLRNA